MSAFVLASRVAVFATEHGAFNSDSLGTDEHDGVVVLHIYNSFISDGFTYWAYDVSEALAAQIEHNSQKNLAEDSYSAENYSLRAVISTGQLRLRSEPSTYSEIVAEISRGTVVDVLYQLPDWVSVYFDGYTGYLKIDFVRLYYGDIDTSYLAEKIVAHSKQFLGTPYLWGGNDLRRGIDCSGFVHHVFRDYGVYLCRSSAAMAQNGVQIGRYEIQAGDLLLFDTAGGGIITHVGLYIGGGDFIHSSNMGVVISSLYEPYYLRTYMEARRVL